MSEVNLTSLYNIPGPKVLYIWKEPALMLILVPLYPFSPSIRMELSNSHRVSLQS